MFHEVAFLVSVGMVLGWGLFFFWGGVWGWGVRGCAVVYNTPKQGNQNIKQLYLVPAPFEGVPTKP